MELNTLKPAPGARKNRKRVGRGSSSGTGKTSGRGQKGQKSRSGYSRHYGFEGGQMPLHRRLPKRGFNHAKRWPMAIVNIDGINSRFEDGAEITSEDLIKAGLVRELKGGVKVLGRGEISKKVHLKVQAISPSAQAKIEAVGGTVETISIRPPSAESPTAEEATAPVEAAPAPVAEEVTAPVEAAPAPAPEAQPEASETDKSEEE